MWLVDTSVWIATFRKGGPSIEEFVPLDDVVTALPVVQEILQGFAHEGAFALARESLMALPMVESPMGAEVFLEAAQLYRATRRAGYTVRSSVDCLIAACALRHNLAVLHDDRDFDAITRISPLESRNIR